MMTWTSGLRMRKAAEVNVMIVLDTDIVTLISYGQNEKVRRRLDETPEGEELAITVIAYMEVLQGRFDNIVKAAKGDELLRAMDRFLKSREFLARFKLLDITDAAVTHFTTMTAGKKNPK